MGLPSESSSKTKVGVPTFGFKGDFLKKAGVPAFFRIGRLDR
ncbi:hypothetical protein [Leptospira adleri]|nr:hypothetical protein [Leptospira adleri]